MRKGRAAGVGECIGAGWSATATTHLASSRRLDEDALADQRVQMPPNSRRRQPETIGKRGCGLWPSLQNKPCHGVTRAALRMLDSGRLDFHNTIMTYFRVPRGSPPGVLSCDTLRAGDGLA